MTRDFRQILIGPTTSIREAMRVIDDGAMEIALVVDEGRRLVGTATDGDIRRAILGGRDLGDPVHLVMCTHFKAASAEAVEAEILSLMQQHTITQAPLLDREGRVVGLRLLREFLPAAEKTTPVLIMAGGLGSRMRPLTDEMPKPMLKVGPRPLIETIVEQLGHHGFRRILISVRFKSELIEECLGDGRRHGVSIVYVREDEARGTAGAIRLAQAHLDETFLVVNGDLLTNLKFDRLLSYHREEALDLTVCTRRVDFRLAFGVLDVRNGCVAGVEEKPRRTMFLNAGLYAVDPSLVPLVPAEGPFDMTDLITAAVGVRRRVGSFLLREYWLDVGRLEDLERASADYARLFQPMENPEGTG